MCQRELCHLSEAVACKQCIIPLSWEPLPALGETETRAEQQQRQAVGVNFKLQMKLIWQSTSSPWERLILKCMNHGRSPAVLKEIPAKNGTRVMPRTWLTKTLKGMNSS